jgi:hypothetical protein
MRFFFPVLVWTSTLSALAHALAPSVAFEAESGALSGDFAMSNSAGFNNSSEIVTGSGTLQPWSG